MKLRAYILSMAVAGAVMANAMAADSVAPAMTAEVAPAGATEGVSADSLNRAVATVISASVDEVLGQLTAHDLPIDRAAVGRYIADRLADKDLGFTRQSANRYIDSLIYAARPDIPTAFTQESQEEYLVAAAATDGAITTPSGLVFIVLTEGEGAQPTIKDKVSVAYQAKLSDGTVFDSTDDGPVEFDVAGVVPGFSEGLQLMRPGGIYRVVIPSNLAYGPEGIPGIIPGNAALDFTVSLMGVK